MGRTITVRVHVRVTVPALSAHDSPDPVRQPEADDEVSREFAANTFDKT